MGRQPAEADHRQDHQGGRAAGGPEDGQLLAPGQAEAFAATFDAELKGHAEPSSV